MTAETLQSRISRLKPIRVRMPYDLTVRAYIRAAVHHNPEYQDHVPITAKHLRDAGFSPLDSMLNVINAAASIDPALGNNVVYDLLVEPFV